jgi:hypothetical protein
VAELSTTCSDDSNEDEKSTHCGAGKTQEEDRHEGELAGWGRCHVAPRERATVDGYRKACPAARNVFEVSGLSQVLTIE